MACPRRTRPPAALIIECDATTLKARNQAFGSEIKAVVDASVPNAQVELVRVLSQQQLLVNLARCKETNECFPTIAVIGHANIKGIRVAPDLRADWAAFAQWLLPFRPRTVILAACEAGRWLPSRAMFEGIPSLRTIYGSPVLITKEQASAIKLLLPYLLLGGKIMGDGLLVAQAIHFFATGGVFFRRTKTEFQETGVSEGIAWTVIEEWLKAAARQLGQRGVRLPPVG